MEEVIYQRKAIKGFEGLYEVDTNGVVYSLSRIIKRSSSVRAGKPYPSTTIKLDEKPLRVDIHKNGYPCVNLYCGGRKKAFSVHRLVAEAFIPNPNGYPFVNHIDEDKANNTVSNLEWCTPFQNTWHSIDKVRSGNRKHIKSVDVYTRMGVFVGHYDAMIDAARATGVNIRYVSKCANGEYKKTHGFIFIKTN